LLAFESALWEALGRHESASVVTSGLLGVRLEAPSGIAAGVGMALLLLVLESVTRTGDLDGQPILLGRVV
jgi:hypothetical protein